MLVSDESLFLVNGKMRMCDGFGVEYEDRDYKHLNCKVIGEFVCDRIDEIYQCNSGWVSENACISKGEFFDYLGIPRETHMGYDKKAYAWHISDIVIYENPKELSKFNHCGVNYHFNPPITRPPQSWCYVEEKGGAEE